MKSQRPATTLMLQNIVPSGVGNQKTRRVMKHPVCIVWFKRDLRVNDHAPLLSASQSGIPVLPLYVVEQEYWSQPFASRRHWHFIHDCLYDLNTTLTQLGQPLIIKMGDCLPHYRNPASHL